MAVSVKPPHGGSRRKGKNKGGVVNRKQLNLTAVLDDQNSHNNGKSGSTEARKRGRAGPNLRGKLHFCCETAVKKQSVEPVRGGGLLTVGENALSGRVKKQTELARRVRVRKADAKRKGEGRDDCR